MKWEYVASGLMHTRVSRKVLRTIAKKDPRAPEVAIINQFLKGLQGVHNHDFSVLFNGYIEKELGKILEEIYYPDSVQEKYADSGGLQMVTLGHTVTDKMKEDVYKTQARYSSIGMSFDEIPVKLTKASSARTDMGSRLFDPSKLQEKAQESGANLKAQIEFFLKGETSCRPMLILQGNCFETYQQWADIVLKEVGDLAEHIGGISSGAAALGQGLLECYKRIFYILHLDLPDNVGRNHYHLLGVGSLIRLMPAVAMYRAGQVPDDLRISYDSTTHTSGLSLGNYYLNGLRAFGKSMYDKDFHEIYDNLNGHMDDLGLDHIPIEAFFDRLSQPKNWNPKYDAGTYDEYLHSKIMYGTLYGSVKNFMAELDGLCTDKQKFKDFVSSKKMTLPTKAYMECKTIDDFSAWERDFSKYIPTTPVKKVEERSTLEDFF